MYNKYNKSIKKIFIILLFFPILLFSFSVFNNENIKEINAVSKSWYPNFPFTEIDTNYQDFADNNKYITFDELINNSLDYYNYYIYNTNISYKIVINDVFDLYNFSVIANGSNVLYPFGKYSNILYESAETIEEKNSMRNFYLSLDYLLGNDINYDEASQLGLFFIPIGSTDFQFCGSFDGQGFEIENLFFKPIMSEEEYNLNYPSLVYYSMFSHVSLTGVVKNVGLINPIMIQASVWGEMEYASPLIGRNDGLIKNVFMIDSREDSGISVEGGFYLSGLVCINNGKIENAFYSGKTIRSFSVSIYQEINPVIIDNTGLIINAYYDSTIYDDIISKNIEGIVPLATTQFQDDQYFSKDWYFNNSYIENAPEAKLSNKYPVLHGLEFRKNIDNKTEYIIKDAIDLLIMVELIQSNSYFASQTYVLTNCIDMKQVSYYAYKVPGTTFSGVLTSDLISEGNCNHNHYMTVEQENEKVLSKYHAIKNLNITHSVTIGNNSSYGLFGFLSGKVENINLINVIIKPLDSLANLGKVNSIGVISGFLVGGSIKNTHISATINLGTQEIGKYYVGGLVGFGNGIINYSSTNGTIDGGIHQFNSNANNNAIGGVIGFGENITISQTFNSIDIEGISFINSNSSTLYIGGLIGTGSTKSFSEVVNYGIINSHDNQGYINNLYIGGIVGLHTNELLEVRRIFNKGNINLLINNITNTKIAGFGNIISQNSLSYFELSNSGVIDVIYPNGINNLSESILDNVSVEMAGIAITRGTNATFKGLNNYADFDVDLTVVNNFAGILIANNNYSTVNGVDNRYLYDNVSSNYGTLTKISRAYNFGNINALTTNTVTDYQIKLSGNTLGKNIDYDQLRNDGNLFVYFSHNTNKLLKDAPGSDGISESEQYKNLKVMGILEEVSQNRYANNLYNNGNINIGMIINDNSKVKFNLYISGIAYKNGNTNLYSNNNYDHRSVDLNNNIKGSIHNAINNGDIYSKGKFYGQSRFSGIVTMNESMLSSCFNTGNIYNENETYGKSFFNDNDNYIASEFEVETAGITFLMLGQYAQIIDSANYGKIASNATSQNGWVNASGIAVRNDKKESGQDLGGTGDTTTHYGKIKFTINYGDVFAWNHVNESAYTLGNESRCKSAGILTLGVLSTINVINFGNIYSKYVASGMFGFVFFQKYSIGENSVFLANSINYGKVRRIFNTDSTSPFIYDHNIEQITIADNKIDNNYINKSSDEYAFGGLIGKVHTGSATGWNFSTGSYALKNVVFSYLINFDNNTDIIGNSPSSTTSDPALVTAINANMANIKVNDLSAFPFDKIKSYSLDTTPITGNDGLYGTTFSGIFANSFILRTPPTTNNFITDQFINDFIQFIPYSKVNNILASKIGLDVVGQTYGDATGIYALSSSSGIKNGEFLPDNVDLDALNIVSINENYEEVYDDAWQGKDFPDDLNAIYYKFNKGMKQLKKSIATNIFDIQLISKLNPEFKLKNPEIDLINKTITYYIARNADEAYEYDQYGNLISEERFYMLNEPVYKNNNQTVEFYFDIDDLALRYDFNFDINDYELTYSNVDIINIDLLSLNNLNVNRLVKPGEGIGDSISVINRNTGENVWTGYYLADGTRLSGVYLGDYNLSSNNFSGPFVAGGNSPRGYILTVTGKYEYVASVPKGQSYYSLTTIPSNVGLNNGEYIYVSSTNSYQYVGPDTNRYSQISYPATAASSVEVRVSGYKTNLYTVNLDDNMYKLSFNASFYYKPTPQSQYETMISDIYIPFREKEVSSGNIRIFSEAYDPQFPNDEITYQDYVIKIIKTKAMSYSQITDLKINGENSNYSMSEDGYTATISDQQLYYKYQDNLNGVLSITYSTINIPDKENLLDKITLYGQSNEGFYNVLITENFSISGGIASVPSGYDTSIGKWNDGTVSYLLTISEFLPSGNYKLVINLSKATNYSIVFTKMKNREGTVNYLNYNDNVFNNTSILNSYSNKILVGSNDNNGKYQPMLFMNKDENINNLLSLENVSYDNLKFNIPSYLNDLRISQYSTLKYVTIDVEMYNGIENIHRYAITYYIQPEDETISPIPFTHYLLEEDFEINIKKSLIDGNEVEGITNAFNQYTLSFEREENPLIRLEYNFSTLFLTDDSNYISVSYSGSNLIDNSFLINAYDKFGFETKFYDNANPGEYNFFTSYSNECIIPKINYINGEKVYSEEVVVWNIKLQDVIITKKLNNNTKLKNIGFVTDTIYSGLNIIIDNSNMDANLYENYLLNPINRKIIALPSAIYYHDYLPEPTTNAYYIIGQVQKTNLEFYRPTFSLPIGAKIYKEISYYNDLGQLIIERKGNGSINDNDLSHDFSPNDYNTDFNYIKYVIVAENGIDETNYFIAVQDVTYNIYFDVNVNIDPIISNKLDQEKIFITFYNYQTLPDGTIIKEAEYINSSMSLYAFVKNGINNEILNNEFMSNSSGYYKIKLHMLSGYGFTFSVNNSTVLIDDEFGFIISPSIVPKKYIVNIIITEEDVSKEWGQNIIINI